MGATRRFFAKFLQNQTALAREVERLERNTSALTAELRYLNEREEKLQEALDNVSQALVNVARDAQFMREHAKAEDRYIAEFRSQVQENMAEINACQEEGREFRARIERQLRELCDGQVSHATPA